MSDGKPTTWLGELLVRKPEECRAEIEHKLRVQGGNVTRSAVALGVSRPFLWYCLRKLGMSKVPEQERRRWRERFTVGGIKEDGGIDARADSECG